MEKSPHHRIILDMDSSESPVHGEQERSAYNGHFKCNCYHPLFCFNQYGDCEGAMLRSGNVHSADRWKELLEPIVNGMNMRKSGNTFAVMLHLRNLRFMNTLKRKGSCMLSAFGRMISCTMRLNICWLVLLVALQEDRLFGFMISSTGRILGTRGAVWWRRLSGAVEIYSREQVLAWPTWVQKQQLS